MTLLMTKPSTGPASTFRAVLLCSDVPAAVQGYLGHYNTLLHDYELTQVTESHCTIMNVYRAQKVKDGVYYLGSGVWAPSRYSSTVHSYLLGQDPNNYNPI